MAVQPKVRKPGFDFHRVKKHYLADNAVATHFLNSMQVIVPIGEEFFIRSVNPFVTTLRDPAQLKRVKAFIGQEKVHEKAHIEFWQAMESHGLDIEPFKHFYEGVISTVEPAVINLLGKKFALSTTVALEHYTAVMAAYLMQEESAMLATMQPEARDLMAWHFAEEIEHKSVAFDLLRKVDASYLLRAGGMVFATAALFSLMTIGMIEFVRQDKQATPLRILQDLLAGGGELISLMTYTAEQVVDYLGPDFHPDQNDNYHLVDQFVSSVKEVA